MKEINGKQKKSGATVVFLFPFAHVRPVPRKLIVWRLIDILCCCCWKVSSAVLDHNFGSKFLLQQLSWLGLTVSYDEVECYRQSVLQSKCPDSGIGQSYPSGLTHNIRTLDGHGSFHEMGIISASVSLMENLAQFTAKSAVPSLELRRLTSLAVWLTVLY